MSAIALQPSLPLRDAGVSAGEVPPHLPRLRCCCCVTRGPSCMPVGAHRTGSGLCGGYLRAMTNSCAITPPHPPCLDHPLHRTHVKSFGRLGVHIVHVALRFCCNAVSVLERACSKRQRRLVMSFTRHLFAPSRPVLASLSQWRQSPTRRVHTVGAAATTHVRPFSMLQLLR
jgi:hypothetical protein